MNTNAPLVREMLPTGKGKSVSSSGVSLPLVTTHQGRSSNTTQNELHFWGVGWAFISFCVLGAVFVLLVFCLLVLILIFVIFFISCDCFICVCMYVLK